MKKIALLLVIAAMCTPGYGSVMVYSWTGTTNPLVNYDSNNGDIDYTSANVTNFTMRGFLVFDVNLATGAIYAGDANDANSPTMTIYESVANQKFQTTLGGGDTRHASTVFLDTPGETNSIASFNVSNRRHMEATVLKLRIADSSGGINLQSPMFGINTNTVIKPRTRSTPAITAKIAQSMCGSLVVTNSPDTAEDMIALGTSRCTYAPYWTHLSSVRIGLTVSQVVNLIRIDLSNRHFQDAR